MEEITMSARELLFAGAQLGADRFFGIPDPFYGMTEEQILSEIPKLQSSLEKRGLAQMGFDDSFTLIEEVKALVAPCALCRRYLLHVRTLPDGGQQAVLVYTDGDAVVEAECHGQEVTLRALEPGDAIPRVLARMRPGNGGADQPAAHLRRADLSTVQAKAIDEPAAARQELETLGCTALCAALLVEGFRHETEFHQLIHADLDRRTLDHAMSIQSEQGVLWLTLEDPDEELWLTEYLPAGVDAGRLTALYGQEGAGDEVL
ncbi:MAG TPA: ESX secretion-associated protein EspG [Candidatus Fournierella excrementavium]|nr:ESX secretion-associated protein EspG [Candidatus Fournierella excrementavium]